MWDRVFERKTALALKETLEHEDPKVMKLPRVPVIKDKAGKDVGEWKALHISAVGWWHRLPGNEIRDVKDELPNISNSSLQLHSKR